MVALLTLKIHIAIASGSLHRTVEAEKPREILEESVVPYRQDTNTVLQPWYLLPNYSPTEILIDADGSVRGGTVPALVERLTAHEHGGNKSSNLQL
jgi:son of sevenless-like protein